MFQFARFPSRLRDDRVSPLPGFPIRISPTARGCTRLVGAFRSVPRPSSALDAKASPVCSYSLFIRDTERPILSPLSTLSSFCLRATFGMWLLRCWAIRYANGLLLFALLRCWDDVLAHLPRIVPDPALKTRSPFSPPPVRPRPLQTKTARYTAGLILQRFCDTRLIYSRLRVICALKCLSYHFPFTGARSIPHCSLTRQVHLVWR